MQLLGEELATSPIDTAHVTFLLSVTIIIRLHRTTMYVDAGYCYRPTSMVYQSVVCHSSKPCKNKPLKQYNCRLD